MITKTKVALVGHHDGSAGQIDTWFELATGFEIVCFVIDHDSYSELDVEAQLRDRVCKTTEFPRNGLFRGRPLVVAVDWISAVRRMGVEKVICLDSDNLRRLAQVELVRGSELELVSAIHPSAQIHSDAKVAAGVWINAGSIVGYKAELEAGVILNTGVSVDHHNILESCCQLDPGVVSAGNVVFRRCSHVHTGATIINRVEIGVNAIVGAGAVVLKNVAPNCTVVGNPARMIKQ